MWTAVKEKKFESDLRINELYLSSSENKARKKIQVCTGFEPMTFAISVQRSTKWANKPSESWFAVHRYDFHKFTVVYFALHGFIWNQHNDQLPVGIHES